MTAHSIAVLGLGRMGSAVAARLTDRGHDVVGWTRSGRPAGAARTVRDPGEAVAKADVVVLTLFDGRACEEVVDRVHRALRPGTIVVNTATVAPAEAAALAGRLGSAYVHAPVLGSVPAVAAGTLHLLVGADPDTLAEVRPVLDALGTVRPCGDAPAAAALKLIANSSLAGAVLSLREALRQADALGLPRAQVLDVLELGHLSAFVSRKRPFLTGERGPEQPGAAQFTVGALAKDMALLADASGVPLRSAADLTGTSADPQSDVAVAATAPGPDDAVLEPLRAYVRGHATGDPGHFRDAFLPTAHISGIREGGFVSWDLEEYCALFPGTPAPDEPTRRRRVDAVDVHGSVATASMTLWHGPDTFTDVFLLVRTGEEWRIADKAYHRHQHQHQHG
ncbi:nuclear transport factor 2 family protein [Streptomyces sp. NPDC004830]